MEKTIQHQLFFPHPPEAVWEYITNAGLMELWLMKNDFRPIEGHAFQFRANPVPTLNFDGIIYCKVLEIVHLKTLSYSWKLGPGDGTISIDSVVRWQLQPKDNGTELALHHGNFTIMENLDIFNSMYDGWLKNINKIADRLNAADHGTARI